MAACGRVQLLLLLLAIPACICSIQGAKSQNIHADVNAGDNANDGKNAGGGLAESKAGAAASQSRRSSTGWKLAEEEACREDVTRLCSKRSWNNNLAVLECLQDRKEVRRAPCLHDVLVWVCQQKHTELAGISCCAIRAGLS